MRSLTLALSLLTSACVIAPLPSVAPVRLNRLYETVRPHVVPIYTDAGRKICAAFWVEGALVTATHCLQTARFLEEGGRVPTKPLASEYDVTVLALKDVGGLPLAQNPPAIGSQVAAFGYGFGWPLHMTVGIISGAPTLLGTKPPVSASKTDKYQRLDMTWVKGMSGGPVVDTTGTVVGQVSISRFDNADAIQISVPPEMIRTAIQKARLR